MKSTITLLELGCYGVLTTVIVSFAWLVRSSSPLLTFLFSCPFVILLLICYQKIITSNDGMAQNRISSQEFKLSLIGLVIAALVWNV